MNSASIRCWWKLSVFLEYSKQMSTYIHMYNNIMRKYVSIWQMRKMWLSSKLLQTYTESERRNERRKRKKKQMEERSQEGGGRGELHGRRNIICLVERWPSRRSLFCLEVPNTEITTPREKYWSVLHSMLPTHHPTKYLCIFNKLLVQLTTSKYLTWYFSSLKSIDTSFVLFFRSVLPNWIEVQLNILINTHTAEIRI